jgi:sugar phosphate permease
MGQAFGGFGSTVSAMYSWQQTFIFFGFVGMAYAAVLMFFLKDSGRPALEIKVRDAKPVGVFDGLFSLLKSPPFWIIVIYFAVPSLPGWAIKNWAPTLISQNLGIEMSRAGPIATISISISSLLGVLTGGVISDRWVQKNIRARIYVGAIGLLLTVPAMLLMGFGTSLLPILSAAFLFGFGFGMFDTNNMPILCQFVRPDARATAYGFLNTAGIFSGALITDYLGKSTDAGNLGRDFAWLGGVVVVAVVLQLSFLRPKPQTTNVNV